MRAFGRDNRGLAIGRHQMKIPDTAAEITLEWLDEIVPHEFESCQLVSFAVDEQFSPPSFYCDVSRVELSHHTADCGPASLIIKFPTATADVAERTAAFGLYDKESNNYKLLSQYPNLAVPKLYGSFEGTLPGHPVVVIEDLSPARPVQQSDFMTVADVESVLVRLADVHSVFWGKENLPLTPVEMLVAFGERQIDENWDAFIAIFGDRLGDHREAFEWLRPNISSLVSIIISEPLTLGHWDLQQGNVLFSAGSQRNPTIIDWQTASSSLAATDVSRFVIGVLSVEDRRSHENALISTYFSRLKLGLDSPDDYSFKQFKLDYRASSIFLMIKSIAATGGMGGRLVRDDFTDVIERNFAQAIAVIDDLDPIGALKELGY